MAESPSPAPNAIRSRLKAAALTAPAATAAHETAECVSAITAAGRKSDSIERLPEGRNCPPWQFDATLKVPVPESEDAREPFRRFLLGVAKCKFHERRDHG